MIGILSMESCKNQRAEGLPRVKAFTDVILSDGNSGKLSLTQIQRVGLYMSLPAVGHGVMSDW
jgi:hypothetical protein